MEDLERERQRSRDLIDQSRLLRKRASRTVKQSGERIERAHHQWHLLAVGRVCLVCQKAQAPDEFDDVAPCEAS